MDGLKRSFKGVLRDLQICILGNSGPYMKESSLDVRAKFTLFHWSTSPVLCLQFMHISLKVFHRGGEGKHLTQATSQIS